LQILASEEKKARIANPRQRMKNARITNPRQQTNPRQRKQVKN